jgi:HK97 family phage major capsid protein
MPTLLEARTKVRELAKKALDTVEDSALSTAEKKTALDTLEPEIKTWTDEVQALEKFEETKKAFTDLALDPSAIDPDPAKVSKQAPWSQKSLGQQFVEHDNYKRLMDNGGVSGKTGRWSTGGIELKATLAEGTAGAPGPGFAPVATPTVLPGIVGTLFQPTTVLDLIPDGVTTTPLLRYLVEVAITNAAAAVAELGLKPESAITFANVDETLKKIATFLPVSDEMLEDFEQIRSYIDARLRLFVALQEEVQVLRGDGTGNNMVGILNRPGLAPTIIRGTAPSVAGDNAMDAVYRQITAVRTGSFLEPDAVVIDPVGWQGVVLAKDNNGQYYAGGPFMSTATPTLWGKPVVATTAMPAETALVGAFKQASQTFTKGEIVVEASNSHADFFQRNVTALRAERRRLLALYRPGAFGIVEL